MFALQKGNVVFRESRFLPEPGGEAAHVLRHPAVVRHAQLRAPRLLQVGGSSAPPLRVRVLLIGPPPGGLYAGVRRVALRGETREMEEGETFQKSTPEFYY